MVTCYNTAKRIFEVLATKENESSTHNAGELCSQDIIKLKPANTLHDAIKKMHNGQISQIPIFDGAIPVGIISESGIVEQSANGNIEMKDGKIIGEPDGIPMKFK